MLCKYIDNFYKFHIFIALVLTKYSTLGMDLCYCDSHWMMSAEPLLINKVSGEDEPTPIQAIKLSFPCN